MGAQARNPRNKPGFALPSPGADADLPPGLHVVATPIGNLGDITLRALQVLAGADRIACEDTRITSRLLRHYGIDTPMTSHHEHNEIESAKSLVRAMLAGEAVALVSDAGTPLVSDPGYRLVQAAIESGIAVWPIPGPSAALAALAASGMPSSRFYFEGFLPAKAGARRQRLQALASVDATLIVFESPRRLGACLADMLALFGGSRRICIARELTKLHEEMIRGDLASLAERYASEVPKGEVVLVLEPPAAETPSDPDGLLLELLADMSVSRAAAKAAELTGLSKRELYKRCLALSSGQR